MRRLAAKIALVAAPFAALAALVAALDPFDYFARAGARHAAYKEDVAARVSPPLWKLAAFRRHPAPNILLGDSRMASLDVERIGAAAGARFANLAYGGGSLQEALNTYRLAARWEKLESVTVGVNLDLYNAANAKDRVTGCEKILANPALYLCDRLVLKTAYLETAYRLTGRLPEIGRPSTGKDEFWSYQLAVTARITSESYRYPEGYRRALGEMAGRCAADRVRLRFLIFPEHDDLTAVAARHGLGPAVRRMADDLASLAETVDLGDIVDRSDRSKFLDPYHFTPDVGDAIVRRVWGGGLGKVAGGPARPAGAGAR